MPKVDKTLVLAMWTDIKMNAGSEVTMKDAAARTATVIGKLPAESAFAHTALLADLMLTEERASALGIRRCDSVQALCASSDVVSIHVPHNAQTHHLIGHAELAAIPDGGFVVNAARGGVVDDEALGRAGHQHRAQVLSRRRWQQQRPAHPTPHRPTCGHSEFAKFCRRAVQVVLRTAVARVGITRGKRRRSLTVAAALGGGVVGW